MLIWERPIAKENWKDLYSTFAKQLTDYKIDVLYVEQIHKSRHGFVVQFNSEDVKNDYLGKVYAKTRGRSIIFELF